MKCAAACLTPLLDAGAALVFADAGPGEFKVLAVEHLLLEHEFVFHAAFEDLERGLQSIRFEGMNAADEEHLECYHHGEVVATIQPVAELGEKAAFTWQSWGQWCDHHAVEYYDAVTDLLRERDPES